MGIARQCHRMNLMKVLVFVLIGLFTPSRLTRDPTISFVFNSSGLTPPILTLLGDYFQNLEANVHSNVNLGEATLSSSQVNVGEDTLPSPVNPAHFPAVDTHAATTANIESQEEGEIATLAS